MLEGSCSRQCLIGRKNFLKTVCSFSLNAKSEPVAVAVQSSNKPAAFFRSSRFMFVVNTRVFSQLMEVFFPASFSVHRYHSKTSG